MSDQGGWGGQQDDQQGGQQDSQQGSRTAAAGWYPTGDGQERWWDGNAWSEHHVRPVQPTYAPPPAAAYGSTGGASGGAAYGTQPYYVSAPQSHTTRNVLLVIGLVLFLLVGGCVAVVGVAGLAVNSAVEDAAADDRAPGGSDNPLEITVGEAFDVRGFSYAAGWSVVADPAGDATVEGLSVTNGRGTSDTAFVYVTLLTGATQVAQITCAEASIPDGATVELTCYSFDPLPAGYDTVTINDAF